MSAPDPTRTFGRNKLSCLIQFNTISLFDWTKAKPNDQALYQFSCTFIMLLNLPFDGDDLKTGIGGRRGYVTFVMGIEHQGVHAKGLTLEGKNIKSKNPVFLEHYTSS